MNNIGEKYAIIDNFDKTVMFFDKSVRLYNGIKIYNEDEKIGGINKILKKTLIVMLSVIMLCAIGTTNVHAEETILDGTLESFEEGTYTMKDEEGDGYWEIVITDNDVASPNYTEYWNSGNFNKTVSANYYNGGSLEVTMQAVFTGKITAGGGSSIYSVYDGYFQSSIYSTVSSSCVVLRSNSTGENPAMGRYSQSVRKISNNESKTFKLTLSLSYYGAATITITC